MKSTSDVKHIKVVGGPMGAETRIEIDGKPVGNVTAFKFQADVDSINKVTMTFYYTGSFEIESEAELSTVAVIPPKPCPCRNKPGHSDTCTTSVNIPETYFHGR